MRHKEVKGCGLAVTDSELVIPRAVSLWTRVRYGFWGGTPEKVEWEGARPREPK